MLLGHPVHRAGIVPVLLAMGEDTKVKMVSLISGYSIGYFGGV